MPLINNLIEKFIKHLQDSGKANSTLIAYKKDIEQCCEYLKSQNIIKIEDIELIHLQDFLKYLQESKRFNLKTISRKINSIRTFFKFLEEAKIISSEQNISTGLKHPKIESKMPRILTKVEYMALRDASRAKVRLYTMVELLLQAGLRIGELQRLEVSDIRKTSKGRSYLHIKKFGSHPERKVPLNETAERAINKYLGMRIKNVKSTSDNIFLTQRGNPIPVRNIRASIKRLFKKAGIRNATINDIRNTFIVHHLSNGVNLLTVAKIVGHKRISTTEKYLKLINAKEDKEKLSEL